MSSPTNQVAPIPVGPDAVAAMSPSNYVTAQTLRDGDPAEREAVHLTSADDKFTVGSWRAEPYAEYIENYPGDEYTRVLEGSITLTGDDGVAHTFERHVHDVDSGDALEKLSDKMQSAAHAARRVIELSRTRLRIRNELVNVLR